MEVRTLSRLAAFGAAATVLLAACSGSGASSPAPTAAPATQAAATARPPTAPAATATQAPSGSAMADPSAAGGDMAALVTAAKAEGALNVIALPRDWCNYGALLDGFKAKYGLAITEINPNGGSGDELEAIRANKDNKGPQAPDVIDVGVAFGPQAVADGLLAPYKVSSWDSIDQGSKDPAGYWYGDYYGVLAFEVNTDVVTDVPHDWSDLLKPAYKHSIALAGDPTASNQAIQSVYAAALAHGGSLDDAQPGLDFFQALDKAGNLVHTIAATGTLASGETPIVITWSYLALAARDSLAGNPNVEVVVPASARFGGLYAQAISAYAPHPNAAKLWEEYIYSDEGQLAWLSGYCYTTRFGHLRDSNAIPSDLSAKLPDVSGAVFPSDAQLTAAKALITAGWKTQVGATIAAPPSPTP